MGRPTASLLHDAGQAEDGAGDPGGERRERPRPVSHAEGGPTGPTSTDGCHRPSVEGAIPSMRE